MAAEIFEDFSNEWRMIIIGKTGCGKSTLANAIIGEKHFHAQASASSVTQTCNYTKFCKDNRSFLIVDTPGLFDSNKPNEEIIKEVEKVVEISYPGPHIFLMIINATRITKEEKETVEILSKLFGKDLANYLVIVFSHVDDLESENTSLEAYLNGVQDENLKQLIDKSKGSYLGFSKNWSQENIQQFRVQLFEKLNILTSSNKDNYYSSKAFENSKKKLQATKQDEEERLRRSKEAEEELERKRKELEQMLEEIKNRQPPPAPAPNPIQQAVRELEHIGSQIENSFHDACHSIARTFGW